MPSVDFVDGNVNLYVAEGNPTAPATLSVVTLFAVVNRDHHHLGGLICISLVNEVKIEHLFS